MIKLNNIMWTELKALDLKAKDALDVKLVNLIGSGFVQKDSCFFLKSLVPGHNVNSYHFQDDTGLECFINSFHIKDYVDEDHLRQGMIFAEELLKLWTTLLRDDYLNVIISVPDELIEDDSTEQLIFTRSKDCVVKFHVQRLNEDYLDDNLYPSVLPHLDLP